MAAGRGGGAAGRNPWLGTGFSVTLSGIIQSFAPPPAPTPEGDRVPSPFPGPRFGVVDRLAAAPGHAYVKI